MHTRLFYEVWDRRSGGGGRRSAHRQQIRRVQRVAVQPLEEQVDTDVGKEDAQEADNRDPGRRLAAPAAHEAAVQVGGIDDPRDQRPRLFRIPRPVGAPCGVGPHGPCNNPDAQEEEAEARKNKYVLVTEPAKDGKLVTGRFAFARFWLQARGRPLPVYELGLEEGADHAKTFHVSCYLSDDEPVVTATGSSRKDTAALLAKEFSLPRREAYKMVCDL